MTQPYRGFTLIELLITIAIIGILASIAYPSYQGSVLKTRRAEGKSALMQLMIAQERYYSQHNTYKTFTADPSETGFKWFSGNTAQSSFYQLSAQACLNAAIEDCVLISATPGGEFVNRGFKDTVCATLTLDNRGQKGAADKKVPEAPPECWQ
jgi:type IV pilus assembly protein PilE